MRREGLAHAGFEDVTEAFEPTWRAWLDAAAAADALWFDEHLADEFCHIMGTGESETKDRVIATNAVVRNARYEPLDLVARRYGTTIVAQGQYFARGDIPTGLASEDVIDLYAEGVEVRFSTVWVPVDGELRCVVMQSATVVESSLLALA